VREVLRAEVELSANGPQFVHRSQESKSTIGYRRQINSDGSPSEQVAASYVWHPGTELGTMQPGDGKSRGLGQQSSDARR
jgi:hypothetical protein